MNSGQSISCAACQKPLTASRSKKCNSCSSTFHLLCVNLGPADKAKLNDKWVCPACRVKAPRGDNTNTPIRASASVATVADGVSPITDSHTAESPPPEQPRAEKKVAISSSLQCPDSNLTKNEFSLTDIGNELRKIHQDMAELKSSLMFLTEGFKAWSTRVENLESRLHTVEEKVSEITVLKGTVLQLQEQLNTQSQLALKNEVELMGINEQPNENLHHIIMTAATKVGVKIDSSEIDWISRAGPRKIVTSSSTPNYPRPVIVKLLRRGKRDELLKASKSRRDLYTDDIEITGPKRKIFINEHLTKSNRMLFRDARLRAKEHGFKFCWVNNGLIHIRKEEGKPAVNIRTSQDLDRLLGGTGYIPYSDPTAPTRE